MKIIFAGTPEFAATILKGLLEANLNIEACYSQPDRPKGRGKKLLPTPVKLVAEQHKIPVFQPVSFKSKESIEQLKNLNPDLIIVAAYGLILPQKVLDIPTYGCINIHASILPKWRGASPVQHSILSGDKETGVTIMQMDAGLDTGDILEIAKCKIEYNDSTKTLLEKLAKIGVAAMLNVIEKIKTNTLTKIKQINSLATIAPKINKENASINWYEPAEVIERKIRAYYPWPICYFTLSNGEKIKIIEAKKINFDDKNIVPGTLIEINRNGIIFKAKENAIAITKIQFPGSKILSSQDVKNSAKYMNKLSEFKK